MTMKVTYQGTLVHILGRTEISGWTVDSERLYPSISEGEGRQRFIACVLVHIGRTMGVELREATSDEDVQPLPECFDAERLALDAIAVARWQEMGK